MLFRSLDGCCCGIQTTDHFHSVVPGLRFGLPGRHILTHKIYSPYRVLHARAGTMILRVKLGLPVRRGGLDGVHRISKVGFGIVLVSMSTPHFHRFPLFSRIVPFGLCIDGVQIGVVRPGETSTPTTIVVMERLRGSGLEGEGQLRGGGQGRGPLPSPLGWLTLQWRLRSG